MDNNDLLIRLRYALNIKDNDMVKIFRLGGVELTIEEVRKILTKSDDGYHDEARSHDEIDQKEENIKCNNKTFESFLNGFIIYKRGVQDVKPGQEKRPLYTIKSNASVNNVFLKKVKIALSLTTDDILDIFEKSDVLVTKGELSAFLRKDGHKNYKDCMDNYARNFLRGLAIKYRG